LLTTSSTLLRRLQQQPTPEDWKRFVSLYTPLLLRWARRLGFDDDAEDVVQETLAHLISALPRYQRRDDQPFRSWLFRLARNRAEDFRRCRANRTLPGMEEADCDRCAAAEEPDESEFRHHLVHRAMELIRDNFSDVTWQAFVDVALGGRPPAEVAARLGITVGAVYKARYRILTRLREEIGDALE
jgi:RNA polymerase sigma-70 factor (ECF subfamily)